MSKQNECFLPFIPFPATPPDHLFKGQITLNGHLLKGRIAMERSPIKRSDRYGTVTYLKVGSLWKGHLFKGRIAMERSPIKRSDRYGTVTY